MRDRWIITAYIKDTGAKLGSMLLWNRKASIFRRRCFEARKQFRTLAGEGVEISTKVEAYS